MDNFSIINDAGVDEDLLRNIIDQSGIVSGQILLRLMDGYLPDNAAGSTIPRSLLKYAHDFHIFDEFIDLEWEIAIAISRKYCLRTKSFPAYFSYLLGHELGHAIICVNNLNLHVFSCLIQEHIKLASKGKISLWHELPHEIKFDQFGLFIAEKLFGRKQINDEIQSLIEDTSRDDLARLELMLTLNGSKELGSLRNDLVAFAKPYQDNLIESWNESIRVLGEKSLATYFDDLKALFE